MKRLIAAIGALAVLAVPACAQAAPAPAWSAQVTSFPTNFAPGATFHDAGPGYRILATNVGGAPTSGTFTIVDLLPSSLEPSGSAEPIGFDTFRNLLSCGVVGRKITCTGSVPIQPGEQVAVTVPVDVNSSVPIVATDKVTIEGGGAAPASTRTATTVSSEFPSFGFLSGTAGLSGIATESDGSTPTQAGSHPYQQIVADFGLPTLPPYAGRSDLVPAGGGVRDLVTELPPGTVVNPGATPRCTDSELETLTCPDSSQVGVVFLNLSLAGGLAENPLPSPLYNMVPPPGAAAELGFEVFEAIDVHLLGAVKNDGSFVLTAEGSDLVAKIAVQGAQTQLWGEPSDESHDDLRGACAAKEVNRPCPVERTHEAFLTLPSSCGGPLTTTVRIDSWMQPGAWVPESYESVDLAGHPVGVDGCANLRFEPTITAKPTTETADSPSGLDFNLHQPQNELYEDEAGEPQLATANLKDTTVTLPAGMTLNPAASNGRSACTSAEIGLATPIGQTPIRFKEEPQSCPDSAKVGTVEARTPLLDHTLEGSVYLASPFDNPFGTLLGIYLVLEDPRSGIITKLPGKVEADPATGRLTTSFFESPELPLEDVELHLFKGDRAPLTTPLACGTETTLAELTPWSTPEGATVHASDSFQVSSAPGGGACPGSEADAPNAPGFSAGTVEPKAGAFSPFVLKVTRPDGSQRLTAIDTALPEGLVGKLSGVPYCPEGAIAQAEARSHPDEGALERQDPSCPLASEVGTVNVGAGSGSSPVYVQGHAYLAGPYKGAPLSLVIITPAVAGPFDLGTVVTRVALNVDLETAQIHAVSEPLPTILDGIPLDVRSIALNLDRPDFTLNPTSCDPQAITGSATSATGASASLSERFQVGGCSALAFKPKVKLQLKGQTKRSGHPALKAVVTFPKQGAYANIARAQVGLPHSEFLDQANLDKVCTQPELKADACPAKSIYGHAKAWTPLLEKPLEGPVYLGVGFGHKLPDVVADLNGQIRILLHGRVDTTKHDGIRNTFEVVPDAPVSRFVLEMKGGKKYGLLQNSENICRKTQKASARFIAQNGKAAQLRPTIANSCKKRKRKTHHR